MMVRIMRHMPMYSHVSAGETQSSHIEKLKMILTFHRASNDECGRSFLPK
ncbi:hypothetical protein NK6_4541 [Bradyrhizobium diazoefficiens]|uniref:Uncharacterized protein n=1 Tax=Bradyrhizobium diazoefficiens TaxID=1355477 RepID=A0A0E4BPX6_9BRAD|nr:hypothetical protein NK6_4541 [Bradyrhizobium diazoefficiens]